MNVSISSKALRHKRGPKKKPPRVKKKASFKKKNASRRSSSCSFATSDTSSTNHCWSNDSNGRDLETCKELDRNPATFSTGPKYQLREEACDPLFEEQQQKEEAIDFGDHWMDGIFDSSVEPGLSHQSARREPGEKEEEDCFLKDIYECTDGLSEFSISDLLDKDGEFLASVTFDNCDEERPYVASI